MFQIRWSFQRESLIPRIDAKCECMEEGVQSIMIQSAVEIIDKANEFNGVLFPQAPKIPITSKVTISFSLLFPSEQDIRKFMEFIQKNH